MKRLCFIILLSGFSAVHAADLGTWGDLYPITEPDLIGTIGQRLHAMEESGELAEKQEAFKQRVIENSLRPKPVSGLAIAQENTTRLFDPAFVVDKDIADHQGTVFARQGQRVNPLDSVPFTQTLYFLDADDKRQLAWFRAQRPATLGIKVILVNGDIAQATQALSTRIYFDQDGVLSKKFALTAVPARVIAAPDGHHLQIDTFDITPYAGEAQP
ncbi:type-F conjugative transfer system protein TraW (plasmid) [Enterobacteriaceae bacterium Kacie_13]|nr:type-F conjugative transfer system protein TraW [Enterobacteriaceae bacterium Kacie_13]